MTAHLDYCNSQSSLSRPQLVQNAAACLLTGTRKRTHITPFLASLHWLLVHFRVHLKIILFSFKSLNLVLKPFFIDTAWDSSFCWLYRLYVSFVLFFVFMCFNAFVFSTLVSWLGNETSHKLIQTMLQEMSVIIKAKGFQENIKVCYFLAGRLSCSPWIIIQWFKHYCLLLFKGQHG